MPLMSVPGFDSMRDLANAVGDLDYETLRTFLWELETKLREDAATVHAEHRMKLATLMLEVTDHLDRASVSLGKAVALKKRRGG